MTPGLCLAEDVFLCETQAHAIFLDLRRDTYSAVCLDTSLSADGGEAARELAQRLAPHLDDLLGAGLLTCGRRGRDLASAEAIETVRGHILGKYGERAFGDGAGDGALAISPRDLVGFLLTCSMASRELRTRHISRIVARVRDRKSRAGRVNRDQADLQRRTAIFRRLRPWYPRGYACMFEALALVEFLAISKIYPAWIFGVQAQPFGAHCWVQVGGVALNESLEYAGQFTPIMAV